MPCDAENYDYYNCLCKKLEKSLNAMQKETFYAIETMLVSYYELKINEINKRAS